MAADDAAEADVNAVLPLAAPPKLGRGRSDATVVLVVLVTTPRHLGVIRGGGETRQKIGLGNVPRGGAGCCCAAIGLRRGQRSYHGWMSRLREKRLGRKHSRGGSEKIGSGTGNS